MNDQNFFKYRCGVCGKKVSTKLCDFIIDYLGVCHFREYNRFKDQLRYETCDLPMCDDCAKNHSGHDFCPHHEKLFWQLKLDNEQQIKAQGAQKSRQWFS